MIFNSIIPLPELEPCQPLCSQPQPSLLLSQTTPIHRSFSKITLVSYNHKSLLSVRWLTRRSMPCTSPSPPTAQHHSSFSEIFIISKGAYQPGSSPAHTAGLFILSHIIIHPHQCSVARQSCRAEAEHSQPQRDALYYRSWLTASPSTGSQRTSHRRAISRPG